MNQNNYVAAIKIHPLMRQQDKPDYFLILAMI
jgi:hypothetical protein